MTDHAQRIAIAEWMGWKRCPELDYMLMAPPKDIGKMRRIWCSPDTQLVESEEKIPNYPADLNAMHEAEDRLYTVPGFANEYRVRFMDELRGVMKLQPQHFALEVAEMIHATAAQRAEALLRTLNRWKDLKQNPRREHRGLRRGEGRIKRRARRQ